MKKKTEFDFVSCSSTNVSPVKTGSWRRITPLFHDGVSPCTDLCPIGEHIPVWMDLVRKHQFEAAWRVLTNDNPFPLICGRVCYRFCEKECNRKDLDDRVSINAVERFLGEYAVTHGLSPSVSADVRLAQLRVAVIGGGPAGLSAAHFLARAGCAVSIIDEHQELGGVLRYGIPEYRMPKKLLQREIANMVTGLGVRTVLRCRVDKAFVETAIKNYDHVIIALGAHKEKKLFGSDRENKAMRSGLQFLTDVSSGTLVQLPEHVRHVCVIGGGNTAIDVARSALRLGYGKGVTVTILYRRSENEMPAHKDEVEVAKREGVQFAFLSSPRSVIVKDDGKIILECVRMTLGLPDESGRHTVHEVDDSSFAIECDSVLTALGEESDAASLIPESHRISIQGGGGEKVICIGDALYGPRSVSEAIASGKKAAERIIANISGEDQGKELRNVVGSSEIKFHYLNKTRKDPSLLHEKKLTRKELLNFSETTKTISQKMAVIEASRCINCGTCIACDRCLSFCPDYAITRNIDGTYSIDLDYCKGCGLCADVCERGAILYGKEGKSDGQE
jgi:NADPH-dependent glutamate synthase beta subunit-like oxidoreductase